MEMFNNTPARTRPMGKKSRERQKAKLLKHRPMGASGLQALGATLVTATKRKFKTKAFRYSVPVAM